jgi:hypothetical protein
MGCCPSFHGIEVVPHTGNAESGPERIEMSDPERSDPERIEMSDPERSDPPPDFDRMLEELERRKPRVPSPKFSFRRQDRMVFE